VLVFLLGIFLRILPVQLVPGNIRFPDLQRREARQPFLEFYFILCLVAVGFMVQTLFRLVYIIGSKSVTYLVLFRAQILVLFRSSFRTRRNITTGSFLRCVLYE